jgi:hypothetical protein
MLEQRIVIQPVKDSPTSVTEGSSDHLNNSWLRRGAVLKRRGVYIKYL